MPSSWATWREWLAMRRALLGLLVAGEKFSWKVVAPLDQTGGVARVIRGGTDGGHDLVRSRQDRVRAIGGQMLSGKLPRFRPAVAPPTTGTDGAQPITKSSPRERPVTPGGGNPIYSHLGLAGEAVKSLTRVQEKVLRDQRRSSTARTPREEDQVGLAMCSGTSPSSPGGIRFDLAEVAAPILLKLAAGRRDVIRRQRRPEPLNNQLQSNHCRAVPAEMGPEWASLLLIFAWPDPSWPIRWPAKAPKSPAPFGGSQPVSGRPLLPFCWRLSGSAG